MADLLMEQLKKLAQSKEFHQAVQKKVSAGEIKVPKAVLLEDATDYAKAFQEILQDCMNEHVMAWGTKLGDDYGFLEVEEINTDGTNSVNVSLTFDNGLNLSPSLDEETYGSVILPRLLNVGFDTNDQYVYGYWKKHNYNGARSISFRGPLRFMEEAVERFNEKYSGVADAEYTPQDAY